MGAVFWPVESFQSNLEGVVRTGCTNVSDGKRTNQSRAEKSALSCQKLSCSRFCFVFLNAEKTEITAGWRNPGRFKQKQTSFEIVFQDVLLLVSFQTHAKGKFRPLNFVRFSRLSGFKSRMSSSVPVSQKLFCAYTTRSTTAMG